MGQLVVLYKPIVVELREENCNTLGKLVAAITQTYPPILNRHDGLEYAIRGAKQGRVALTEGQYDPNAELLTNNRRPIEIKAKFKAIYTVNIRRASAKHLFGGPIIAEVEVYCRDSFGKLKEQIERQTGISKDSQQLEFMGWPMLDSSILGLQRVFRGCTVVLRVMAKITYHFKDASWSITAGVDESLLLLLGRIATNLSEDVSMLRFSFTHASEDVAATATDRPPNPTQLFKAGDVVGSVAENGLTNGGAIQVYREYRKRELNDETVRPSKVDGKSNRQRKRERREKERRAVLSKSVAT
ncbi:hypothetical protein EDD37DRAFT_478092 [Exophiala viscosa]|uniref:uncharacterized protein n=1 Tax=Exophiala viscosa TaxID=2486360 RepID=UPI002199C928|nr:hypothetical protein EDD37DRAFT_478092 [Exophiala viscosa]